MNVGDYVRTINGEIYKLIDDFALIYFQKEQEHGIPEHQIINSSPNIIDLIEVGDYVNGHKVFKKEKYELRVEDRENTWGIAILDETDIKSIVTHEQMEAMQYRVEE
jgi:hypothetical protein